MPEAICLPIALLVGVANPDAGPCVPNLPVAIPSHNEASCLPIEAGEDACEGTPVRELLPDQSAPGASYGGSTRAVIHRRTASAAEVTNNEGGLSISIETKSGSAMFRPDLHVSVAGLSPTSSWRREIDAKLATPQSDNLEITLRFGAFDTQTPILRGGGGRYGVGAITRSYTNRVSDFGLDLRLFDGLLHYATAISWSRYGAIYGSLPPDPATGIWRLPRQQNGRSYWQGIEANLLDKPDAKIQIYAVQGSMDSSYRSYQGEALTPLIFDGRTERIGGSFDLGHDHLSIMHENIASAFLEQLTTTGKLRTGSLRFNVDTGSRKYLSGSAPGDWSIRDDFVKSDARLALGRVAGGGSWLPDRLNFRVARKTTHDRVRNSVRSVRTRYGAGLGWSSAHASTDVFLTYGKAPPGTDSNGGHEFGLEMTHWLSRRDWDISVYAMANSDSYGTSSHKSLGGGFDFALSRADWPKVSVGMDYNNMDLRLERESYLYSDKDLTLRLSIDLSDCLPKLLERKKPYLKIKAYGDWSSAHENLVKRTRLYNLTSLFVFGMEF